MSSASGSMSSSSLGSGSEHTEEEGSIGLGVESVVSWLVKGDSNGGDHRDKKGSIGGDSRE